MIGNAQIQRIIQSLTIDMTTVSTGSPSRLLSHAFFFQNEDWGRICNTHSNDLPLTIQLIQLRPLSSQKCKL